MAHLHYANEEARAVSSLFGAKPLVGDAATLVALRAEAGKNDVVHLIAHIDVNHDHPQLSSISLGDTKNDGTLKLNDIYNFDLRKTSLVVLSGCESHMGNRTRGDDIFSLSRAFIYAGASSVVANLWSVDDAATEQLMVAFYTHLKAGMGKAEALRAAQTDVRQEYTNPFYWAGFVLTGDPGTLEHSR